MDILWLRRSDQGRHIVPKCKNLYSKTCTRIAVIMSWFDQKNCFIANDVVSSSY